MSSWEELILLWNVLGLGGVTSVGILSGRGCRHHKDLWHYYGRSMKGKRCAIWELVFNAVDKFGNIFSSCHGFAEVTTCHGAPFSRKASESHTDTAHWGKNVIAPWP